jgi:hypothetical protein
LAASSKVRACVGERPHFGGAHPRRIGIRRRVAGDEAPPHGLLERPVEGSVDILDRLGCEAFLELGPVEGLHVGGGEGSQLRAAQGGANMIPHERPVTSGSFAVSLAI